MALITISSKFNFYQQIRVMLRKLRDGSTPVATLLDEKLRIVSTLSLSAPDGQIESIQQDNNLEPPKITAWYNGLTGAMGALPTAYTEWMIERYYRYSDHSAKEFIDLFGHRLYCLDYLIWQKHRLYAQAESQASLPLQSAMLAMTGLLSDGPDLALTPHAHIFASPVRSMVNLERWLSQIFDVPVKIRPFTGGWRAVEEHEQCQLGNSEQTLGTAPMVGHLRLEVHSRFDVLLGPVSPEMSRRFISQGSELQNVWSRIRDYVGPGLDFSVFLTIDTTELPILPLGMSMLGLELCLGRNTASSQHQVRLPPPSFNQDTQYAIN
jgi:type VI secretion system protein ImpH